jgi:hypothetical protein
MLQFFMVARWPVTKIPVPTADDANVIVLPLQSKVTSSAVIVKQLLALLTLAIKT